jgi:hypothetical protein
MYHKWSVSSDYPDSYWFEYDRYESPDHLLFKQGRPIDKLEGRPKFRLNKKVSLRRLSTFDYLLSDGPDLVSPRLGRLLTSLASEDVQCFGAEVYVGASELEGYQVPNITQLVPCLDRDRSDYEPLLSYMPDGPIHIRKAAYIPGSLGRHLVVRMLEDNQTIIVQDALVRACRDGNIRGIAFT